MSKDFYNILGVSRDASPDEIKKAYRKLSKELHPDKHKGDKGVEEKFQEVNEAYEVLSDEKKRRMYDQFGSTGGPGGGAGGGFGGFDFSGFQQGSGDFSGFSDIFETFFGGQAGGGRRQRNNRGSDIEVEMAVDFDAVVHGREQEVTLGKQVSCEDCEGKGAEKGSDMKNCEECGGTGQVVRTAQSFFGTVQQAMVCSKCNGSGKVPEKSCPTCSGEGRYRKESQVTISIPAGIHDGQTLRIRGEGEAGRQGNEAGDLFVHIRVKSDPRFLRDGDDIRSDATVSVLDAILGTEISVETVHGPVTLKVPAGSQPGQVFRLKGKGLTVLGSSRHGDHYVTVQVDIPKKLSKKEKKLLEEWKDISA